MRSSRKDRRRITVDGVVYRYTITPNDGFISLLVRREGIRGQSLRVAFGYLDEWVPVGDGVSTSIGHRLILPGVVRLAILEGLRTGWEPTAIRPGVFHLRSGDSLMPSSEWPRSMRTFPSLEKTFDAD